ncbi:pullulanase-type alpha-1,6-glucosidase [Actinomyces timonensis]|uniref:pullulanase-type alpha-1,6-glucosidase n=1 Tax=Actinomyces timonensis TaxID=1288391 RepID=UPI0002FF12FB|nr:pullulanase-type alpha-1,6-glucosidase [Actinomyces timonensis]
MKDARGRRRTAPSAHHEAPVKHEVPGARESRAYWLDATTLAWPASLLPAGVLPSDLGSTARPPVSFDLIVSPRGGTAVAEGLLSLGDGALVVPLIVAGILDDVLPEALSTHPPLAGYLALSTRDPIAGRRLPDDSVAAALTGQLTIVQRTVDTDAVGHWITACTGVQIWPLLDLLYGGAASRDGSAPLGPTWGGTGAHDDGPAFALWAPTAVEVALLSWSTGDRTGSVPLVDGEPLRTPAQRRADGRWEVPASPRISTGDQYLWEVRVYVPETGRIETNLVTDPYSTALTMDSRRSVAVDLTDPALAPSTWAGQAAPAAGSELGGDAARAIYELHVRDFSAADPTCPPELRGTYAAFGADTAGTRSLRELADAGIDTLHLLPTFDIASIPEDRSAQAIPDIPADAHPASRRPQAAIAAVADDDAYNWGYGPFHWGVPEGSYARDGHQDGGARIIEMREMIGALHAMGLQVVLDQVYNHTAASGQDPRSVLDRIVPCYYHRLDSTGAIEASTCANNIATERAMAERLMIDMCVRWARDYRADGFRFDLMGHHSAATMRAVRDALRAEAAEAIGHEPFLYGEGWNFGEVEDNRLFVQATQGQLAGSGIGCFNDRLRDALRGGSVVDADPRESQGLATGLAQPPSPFDARPTHGREADLIWRGDLIRIALAGNLRDVVLHSGCGRWVRGDELRYGTDPAAFGSAPAESINYVDAHDDETLFDILAYKLRPDEPMEARARMAALCLGVVALGQSPSFWGAGAEMLRSKSLDRDSYNSGDHFNALDWSCADNGWGHGLPPAERNFDRWLIQAGLLTRPELRPTAERIAATRAQCLDFLRLRRSTPLLALGSAELIRERVSFPFTGDPGVIVMVIDDGAGPGDLDPTLDGLAVVINARAGEAVVRPEAMTGRRFHLGPIQAQGADDVVKGTVFDPATGELRVPGRTVAVLVEL